MTYPVKFFSSTDTGAPVMNGTAGSLIGVLDACLISGYNTKSVDSLTWVAGVATATINAGHGFNVGDVVLFTGAADANFNGEFVVKTKTLYAITFDVPGTGLASPVSGTISAKKAPVGGWSKAFAGTNKAVYRTDDVASPRHYLRIDDTSTQYTRARGYETMTDIDTGSGLFPTTAQLANGLTWCKSTAADSTARAWVVVGDGRAFWLFKQFNTAHGFDLCGWGDLVAYQPGDQYATFLIGSETASPANAWDGRTPTNANNGETTGRFMARAFHATGSAVKFGMVGHGLMTTLGVSGGVAFPNLADGSLLLSGVMVVESGTVRGTLPGLWQPLHPTPLTHLDRLAGLSVNGQARDVAMIELSDTAAATRGRVAVDLSGAWR